MSGRYPRHMLRSVFLAAAGSSRLERLVESAPVAKGVVRRFVAGSGTDDALRVARELADDGLAISLDYLGEDTLTAEQALATRDQYLALLGRLREAVLPPAPGSTDGAENPGPLGAVLPPAPGSTDGAENPGPLGAEVSVKLSALGQKLDE